MKVPESAHPARWWHTLPAEEGKPPRIQCDLCPRDCKLHDGQRGACFVRQNAGDRMVLTTYGRSSGFCIDPIEKKPLNHFYPGSSVFSFGTAGCNLACKFCQNWDISKSKDMDHLMDTASPEGIADAALAYGAGASLRNMEFIENWNVPKLFAWEGQTGMLPYGARFLNGEGEDFMRRYSPKLGAKADPHYNVRGMAFEVRAGRGPIYFDTSTMSPEGVEIMTPTGGIGTSVPSSRTSPQARWIRCRASSSSWVPEIIGSRIRRLFRPSLALSMARA